MYEYMEEWMKKFITAWSEFKHLKHNVAINSTCTVIILSSFCMSRHTEDRRSTVATEQACLQSQRKTPFTIKACILYKLHEEQTLQKRKENFMGQLEHSQDKEGTSKFT